MRAVLMFHHLGEGRGPLAYPRATFESLRPRYFAYPFGHHDTEVRRIVAPRYAAAFTTRLAALSGRDDRSRLPRIDAHCLRRQLVYRHLRSPSTHAWLAGRGAVRALRGIP